MLCYRTRIVARGLHRPVVKKKASHIQHPFSMERPTISSSISLPPAKNIELQAPKDRASTRYATNTLSAGVHRQDRELLPDQNIMLANVCVYQINTSMCHHKNTRRVYKQAKIQTWTSQPVALPYPYQPLGPGPSCVASFSRCGIMDSTMQNSSMASRQISMSIANTACLRTFDSQSSSSSSSPSSSLSSFRQ